jgi:hypothetical protein
LREGIFNVNTLAQQLTAGIKLQSALALARDLQQERTTDSAVFTRMVDHKGKQVVTPAIAIKNIHRLMSEAQEQYPVTCRYINMWMEANRFAV